MTEKVQVLNHRESDGVCADCAEKKELRPYGKNGAWVCFDCAMKDEDEAGKQFGAILDGADVTILDVRDPK